MTALFPSPVEEVVFWVIFVIYFATVLVWIARNRGRPGKRRHDLVPLILLAIPLAIAVGYARIGVLPDWLFYPGEILFVGGALFTLWSSRFLGRYLSPYAQVYPDHRVIDDGPYRVIRHPGYLGQIVAFIGLGLALQSWVALLTLIVVAVGVLVQRIRIEEELMATEIGVSYVNYLHRTKRLLPYIW